MHDDITHSHHRLSTLAPFSEVEKFHGHVCPGITIGYRVAETAIKELAAGRDVDEELVAIVENDACGVDAIQVVTGCTIGKGNLIYRDYGKQAYTFIDRSTGNAVRISLKASYSMDGQDPVVGELRSRVMGGKASAEETAEFRWHMKNMSRTIMEAPAEQLFDIRRIKAAVPEKARLFKSVRCSKCGEMVAESRARVQDGKIVCIPCFDEYSRGW